MDSMNTHTPFNDKIYSSNLCVTGDTIIELKTITEEIIKIRIDDFIEQYSFGSFYGCKVKSYDVTTKTEVWSDVTAAAQTAITNELYEIEDETGKIIKCTGEHKIYTKNRGYVAAKDLVESDVLCSEI